MLLLPTCSLALHAAQVPFPASPEAAWVLTLEDFNLCNKQNFTQADKSLKSGETMKLILDPLQDMTKVDSDWREQCMLSCVS